MRCIVITGAGRAFCAGLDLQDASSGTGIGSGGGGGGFSPFDLRNSPPNVLHNIDTPTICALNGGAAGYGMDIAMGCDIRVAAESSKLAAAFTKRGIVPESGGTWYLPRMIGWAKASELIFTGRTLSAKECLEWGLVNSVVPDAALGDAVRSLALEIAANAPLAVQAIKRAVNTFVRRDFADVARFEALTSSVAFVSEDLYEGFAAGAEKRRAAFSGK